MPTDTYLRLCRKASRLADRSEATRPTLQEELETLLTEEGLEESLALPFPEEDEWPESWDDGMDEETREQMTELRALQKALGSVEMPDFDNLQRFVAWALAHYTWRTGMLDDIRQQRRQQRWVLRDRREQAAKTAYETLVHVRGILRHNLRPEAAESILGLSDRTPRLPQTLCTVLEMAVRRMRRPKPYFDDTRIRGQVHNWDDLIAQLEEARRDLWAAERAWADDHAREVHELAAKKEAMTRYRQIQAAARHFAKGLLYLGGRPEWVKDVGDKLPARGPVRIVEPVDPEEAGEAAEEGLAAAEE